MACLLNHRYSVNTTMCSVCVVELLVTVIYITILSAAQECF